MATVPLEHLLLVLDYDGTVTVGECNELILQRFTGDAWREPETECLEGRLSHGECFKQQFALVGAPREELFAAMAACAEPMPGVAEFLAWALGEGARVAVVSVGFRDAIERVWREHGLPPVEIYASELGGSPDDGYRVELNALLGDCEGCGPGGCKGGAVRALRQVGDAVAVFGDGVADLCLAREADLVFARGHLRELCAAEGIAYHSLTDYEAARRLLHDWLIEGRDPPGSGETAVAARSREPAGAEGAE